MRTGVPQYSSPIHRQSQLEWSRLSFAYNCAVLQSKEPFRQGVRRGAATHDAGGRGDFALAGHRRRTAIRRHASTSNSLAAASLAASASVASTVPIRTAFEATLYTSHDAGSGACGLFGCFAM